MFSAFERLFDLSNGYQGNVSWENRLDRDSHL